MSTWWANCKNMKEIWFWQWLFEDRPKHGKRLLPDGLDWLSHIAGSSKSHCEILTSCIFLQSPHQVDMKNVVKWSKVFLGYFGMYSKNTPWNNSQNSIENLDFWLVLQLQTHGGNFELIGQVTSGIPCKDSNIVRYRNGQEKFEPEQWWSVVTSHDLAWPILILICVSY